MTAELFNLKSNVIPVQHMFKSDLIRYTSPSIATINTPISRIQNSFPREGSYNSLQNSYLAIEFEFLKIDYKRYADGDHVLLVNMGHDVSFI